ncbi:MAG: 3'(2'),5'-bisphosphate nucleotidase CysQ [Desulfobacterales bacterium]|nr:MAG: 3'(2'),5'-bisphosphate nucleotidase CysQ [Desulfobacterales bacterium]
MYHLNRRLKTGLLAAIEAGLAILEIYNRDFMVQYKDDRSPLTLADKQSHDIIVARLSEPTDDKLPILSEEGQDISFQKRKEWDHFWLVDPLDGTKEFIKRNGEFTVNIALIQGTRPVLGIIYVPVKEVLYFGATGVGAYKSEKPDLLTMTKDEAIKKEPAGFVNMIINRSTKLPYYSPHQAVNDSQMTIVGSRSHPTKELQNFVENMKKKHKSVEFISAGSSLKLCLVAEGKADIYPRLGPTMEWDTAAGQIIVEQADGSVLNSETNEPLRYNKKNLLNPWFIVRKKPS